jgi:hypothetical protein
VAAGTGLISSAETSDAHLDAGEVESTAAFSLEFSLHFSPL